jgi:hypothetical protein
MAIQSDGRKLRPWHLLALVAASFGRALGETNTEIARNEKVVYRAGHSVEVCYSPSSSRTSADNDELPAAVDIPATPVLQPCSVLRVESFANLSITLEQTFRRFASDDDVWSNFFLQRILLQHPSFESPHALEIQALAEIYDGSQFTFLATAAEDSVVEGPYFIQNGRLRQAYLLYPDVYNAFIVATVPTENDPTT